MKLKKLIFPDGVTTVLLPKMYGSNKHKYCKHCEYTFTDKSAYNKHLRARHPETVSAMEYQCDKCNRGFIKRHHLQTHKTMVHQGNK